jgi:aminobenzoyl-glutamate utilization protein B
LPARLRRLYYKQKQAEELSVYRKILLLAFLPLALPICAAAEEAGDVMEFVDSRYEQTAALARDLWEFAEVGYQEVKSSALIEETLAAEGFEIESGLAGIPTAFVASFGTEGPVIAILAEYDALPGINQDDIPTRSPIEGKLAGQACGHNLYSAGSVAAAITVKHWLEQTGTAGMIRLYGTPAEEGGSGKVYLVRDGALANVDVVLHWHGAGENTAAARTTLANRSAKFRFHGVSTHAAGAPEKARSALDGVEAFNHMVNLMREHVPQETRIHYVITSGGSAPNVVPDFAEVYYYLRHPEAEIVKELWVRLEQAALGAAMGTGVEVDWEIIHGNHSILINETLAKMMDSKLREVGGVVYDEREQAFAKELYPTLIDPIHELGSQSEIQPYEVRLGYGSTDVGDISIAVPTAGLRVATWVPGTPAHSWQAVAASGMSIGFKGAQVAAKTLALTAIELFENPELRADAKAEFARRRGEDFVYEALLGDRSPPLDYRN